MTVGELIKQLQQCPYAAQVELRLDHPRDAAWSRNEIEASVVDGVVIIKAWVASDDPEAFFDGVTTQGGGDK